MNQTPEQIAGSLGEIVQNHVSRPMTRETAVSIDAALGGDTIDAEAAAHLLARLRASATTGARNPNTAGLYAAGVLEAVAGNETGAREAFTQVTAALERAGAWDGFVAAASRALSLTSSPDFARCLARAWEKGGADGVPPALLVEAARIAPDDHRLLWAAGFALDRQGARAESERYIAKSFAGFVEKGEFPRIEEAFLRLLETEDATVAQSLFETLCLLTRHAGGRVAAPYWELAAAFLEAKRLHNATWTFLKEYVGRHADQDALRPAAFRSFRSIARERGIPDDLIDAPGLQSPTRPLPDAITRTDLLLGWPPGLHVDHRFSGIGRVASNNCEMLRIDFPKGTQELSLEIAGRSLLKLSADDMRVRLVYDKEGVTRDLAEAPANIVHSALVGLRGEGSLNDLKRALIPATVPLAAWTDFWKRAQKGMKDDPRFDLSQTVRKIYRIVDPSKRPAVSVPRFDVKEALWRRVDTLEKFLDESPQLADALCEAHAASMAKLYAKEPLESGPRLACALLLLRMNAISDEEARNACEIYFDASDEFPPSVGKDAQSRCLALATGMVDPTPVYLAALASRTKPIREEALGLLAAHYAEDYLNFILKLMVKSPARTPAIFHLVSQPELVRGWPAWDALLALLRIIAAPQRETHEKVALKELAENKSLREGLRDSEPIPETLETLRLELINWRVSERLLLPILEMLDGVGREAFANDVREARRASAGRAAAAKRAESGAPPLAPSGPQPLTSFVGRLLMSQAAYTKLGDEVHEVGMELKTSIPRAIEIARAHGDLRENAEYEAAKDKQRRYAARLTELEEKWSRALVLEPSMVAAGVVGPGTQVEIESVDNNERSTYWILGEGDDIHGENVLSYLAPLGKAFAGRRAGDEASVIVDGHERRYRILSVEVKLPA
ncbi:MAG: GreA/GreB family elongation factor [bacterium]